MNKQYLPYFERLDEKYKQIYMSWDKEKLIDCIVSNIVNGEILLERIDKAKEYIIDNMGYYSDRLEYKEYTERYTNDLNKIVKLLDKGE